MVKGASCAQNRRMRPKSKASRRVLVIDVGRSHVKFRIGARGRIQKFASGPKLTPAAMVKQVRKRAAGQEYAAVSKKVFEVDYVVLGGGNAKHLKLLPKDTRLGNNRNAFRGGLLIWQRRFV